MFPPGRLPTPRLQLATVLIHSLFSGRERPHAPSLPADVNERASDTARRRTHDRPSQGDQVPRHQGRAPESDHRGRRSRRRRPQEEGEEAVVGSYAFSLYAPCRRHGACHGAGRDPALPAARAGGQAVYTRRLWDCGRPPSLLIRLAAKCSLLPGPADGSSTRKVDRTDIDGFVV